MAFPWLVFAAFRLLGVLSSSSAAGVSLDLPTLTKPNEISLAPKHSSITERASGNQVAHIKAIQVRVASWLAQKCDLVLKSVQALGKRLDIPRAERSVDNTTWVKALNTLRSALESNGGKVSSKALTPLLQKNDLSDEPRVVLNYLRYYDHDNPQTSDGLSSPGFRWYHHARSFYLPEQYEKLVQAPQEVEAEKAEAAVEEPAKTQVNGEPTVLPPTERQRNRQQEKRLAAYVRDTIYDIYASDHTPEEDTQFVFDTQDLHNGGQYENIDILAIHWITSSHVEFVSVEVKLDFTAALIQQARNYGRFSDRVWIAVPVESELPNAADYLQDTDWGLFDLAIECGLGILACRQWKGKSYHIAPIHWPRRQRTNRLERSLFVDRYRRQLINASVVRPDSNRKYPNI